MYVVPSSSSACRNSSAPSRVAGRDPTTPSSCSTRKMPLRRATRVTNNARFTRSSLAPTGAGHAPSGRRLVSRGLDALPRQEAVHGFLVDTQHAADAHGIEPAVVDQAPNRL